MPAEDYKWIADIIGLIGGAKEASDKSKSTMSPKDIWGFGNPSSTNPFYNTQSSWNGGNPTINQQMTPQLQQVFDEIIWGALAEGRDPYGKSENMNRLQNLQEQNQLGRYGQTGDPYSPKADAGGRDPYDPIGLVGGADDGGGGTGEDDADIRDPDNGNRNAMDEIQRAIREREDREWRDSRGSDRIYDDPDSGGTMGRDGYWNADDITELFLDKGGNQMYKDIMPDSLAKVADNAALGGEITGAMITALSGLPGFRQAFKKGGQYFHDWAYDNWSGQTPINPADPYGLSRDANVIPTGENLPRSRMDEGNTNVATGGRGSYSGEGNFNSRNFDYNYSNNYSSIPSDARFGSPDGGTLGGRWGEGGSMVGGADADWWRKRRGKDGEDKE